MSSGLLPVLHVSVVHRVDDPRIFDRECRSLAAAGLDVTLLAVATGPDGGAAGAGTDNAVTMLRLPARPRSQRWRHAPEVVRVVRRLRPAVVHLHDPELLVMVPLLRALGPGVVYDMHEHVVQAVLGKYYIPPRLRPAVARAAGIAQRTLAARADGVVVVVDHQLGALGPRPTRRLVLPNYPRFARFADLHPVEELAADERLKLIYIGTLARGRGVPMMLEALRRAGDGVVLYLGGVFTEPGYEDEVRGLLVGELSGCVRLLGPVPPAVVPAHLAAADVVWAPEPATPQYSLPAVSTKLFEGLAAGCAALASDLPGRGAVVRNERCGLAVAPTVEGHTEGLRQLRASRDDVAEMGRRGRAAVRERYSWEGIEGRLIDFYGEICADAGRSAAAAPSGEQAPSSEPAPSGEPGRHATG
jgi:glycosyltransferase involved in cell wall biosynthesis